MAMVRWGSMEKKKVMRLAAQDVEHTARIRAWKRCMPTGTLQWRKASAVLASASARPWRGVALRGVTR